MPRRIKFHGGSIWKHFAVIERSQAVRQRAQFFAAGNETHRIDVSGFFTGRQHDEKIGARALAEELSGGNRAKRRKFGHGLVHEIVNL